jgi:CheY-like chemotaxis protein
VDNGEAVRSSSSFLNEEKDYIYLKKLEVLYIDNDINAQKLIIKNTTDTIHINACDSLYSAFEILESKNFDLILCDMMTSQKILKDFFNMYEQKVPIIAVSNIVDPKIAYLSAKMGAKDYIVKNEKDLRTISRSIHKVYLEDLKEKEKKNSISLLNDTDTRNVLRDLINTELPITQRLNTTFENDILINETIKNTYNIQANDILSKNRNILKSLIKMDLLDKEFIEQTVACPNCKSVNLFIHYICDNCKNSNFKRYETNLHIKCGQIISNKKINNHGKVACPNCKDFYENNSSSFRSELGYQCNICNTNFAKPIIFFSCNSCNIDKFSIDDARWIELYKYKLKSSNINKIKSNLFLLHDLEQFFKNSGYSVKQYEKFFNENQMVGPFELVVYQDKYVYIFIILSKDLQHNLSKIFEIDFVAKFIEKEIKSFAIALFEPQEIVLKLLKKFDIIPIIKEDLVEIFTEIKKYV